MKYATQSLTIIRQNGVIYMPKLSAVLGILMAGLRNGVIGDMMAAGNTAVPFKFYFSDSVLMV